MAYWKMTVIILYYGQWLVYFPMVNHWHPLGAHLDKFSWRGVHKSSLGIHPEVADVIRRANWGRPLARSEYPFSIQHPSCISRQPQTWKTSILFSGFGDVICHPAAIKCQTCLDIDLRGFSNFGSILFRQWTLHKMREGCVLGNQ